MKRLTVTFILLMTIFLSACGTSQADKTTQETVEPLAAETTLPKDGVISKAQMASIVGKDEEYQFHGQTEEIRYTWFYQGQQVQNPVAQKLHLTFTDDNLAKVKEQANHAQEAIGFHLEKMELAGTPDLAITLPTKWTADKAVLVREIDGQLKQVKGADVTVSTDTTTTLRFRVLESDVDYYIVAGNTQTANSTTTASGETTAPSTVKEVTNAAASESAAAADTAADATPTADQSAASAPANDEAAGQTAPENQPTTKQDPTITFSISAQTLLDNWDQLKKEKQPFVPKDGWILAPTEVTLKEGESVYDILVRVTRAAGIQMEASWTPMYDAYYIEGLNQLYEFDCGGLSGWMFQVNGWFPNYGCSKYTDLHDGDVVKWEYTCDLGHDLGA